MNRWSEEKEDEGTGIRLRIINEITVPEPESCQDMESDGAEDGLDVTPAGRKGQRLTEQTT